jgi:acyl carrier protein
VAQQTFTFDQLKDILVNRVGYAESDVGDDTGRTFEELGLDSLAFLEIQAEMEQRYGFQTSEDDADKIHTLQDAIDYVNAQLQGTQ